MFWTKFAELCHAKGESPNFVAAKIGVKSTGTVSGWKKGAVPRDGVLSAIAEYFDVPVSYLLENENKPVFTEDEPLSLDYLRTLSTEQLLQIMKDATQALSEKK